MDTRWSGSVGEFERRAAIAELVSRPDPPDIHRGHVLKIEGEPDRYKRIPGMMMAFCQHRLIDMRGEQ